MLLSQCLMSCIWINQTEQIPHILLLVVLCKFTITSVWIYVCMWKTDKVLTAKEHHQQASCLLRYPRTQEYSHPFHLIILLSFSSSPSFPFQNSRFLLELYITKNNKQKCRSTYEYYALTKIFVESQTCNISVSTLIKTHYEQYYIYENFTVRRRL